MSQQDFAAIIGVSRSFISDVEGNKKPSKYNARHVNALAGYFGMSPREFLPEKAFPVDGVVEKLVTKKAPVKQVAARKGAVKKTARKR
ncbi:hypothetical protein [Paraflavitalea speifideaquila]|uniref:helix-turn-helix domain-containing protein n=1 Tax=Paraflavitalea speifideaquila TaxID=3076558 RepID=UPI0028E2FB1A|nr:hypothetical protein [Paraflavitalea speifideiaquila]